MRQRGGKLIRVLAVAAATAMLVSALPASAATAAKDDACRVYNSDKGIGRNSLQRAVWDADAGDYLLVKGTCVGTTVIRKDLDIGWIETSSKDLRSGKVSSSGKPRIRSGDWRPALIIHPGVDDFSIESGLSVIGGIVVGDVKEWVGPRRPVSDAWKSAKPSVISTVPAPKLRYCRMRNDVSEDEFKLSRPAIDAASARDHLSLRGTCGGGTVISTDLSISGWRLALSSTAFGSQKVDKQDSGPPTIKGLTIDDDVDDFVLKRVRVTRGFGITDVTP